MSRAGATSTLRSLHADLSKYRTRGHRFFGPLTLKGNHGAVHVFDWYFASALRRGYRIAWFQTVIWFELEDRLLPDFSLRPGDLPLSLSIPQYESVHVPGLDRDYQLESSWPNSARRLFEQPSFTCELNSFLITDKWHIDRYDNTLSISAFNRLLDPRELPVVVQEAESVVTLIRAAAKRSDDLLMAK